MESWRAVTCACVTLADMRFQAEDGKCIQAALLGGAGDGLLRDSLALFGAIARHRRQWAESRPVRVQRPHGEGGDIGQLLARCLDCLPGPLPELGGAGATGRALGRVLGAWLAGGGAAEGADTLAEALFSALAWAGRAADSLPAYNEAVLMEGAGAATGVGLFGVLHTWAWQCTADRLTPRGLAWLLAGTRARLDGGRVVAFHAGLDMHGGRVLLKSVTETVVAWQDEDVLAFRATCRQAAQAVARHNARKPFAPALPANIGAALGGTIEAALAVRADGLRLGEAMAQPRTRRRRA